jgi:hypothetical protein
MLTFLSFSTAIFIFFYDLTFKFRFRLTNSKNLFGENRLFATLDTTIHHALLPSRIPVIFADTIGFISDLPIKLFASFTATLRHIENAVFSWNSLEFFIIYLEILISGSPDPHSRPFPSECARAQGQRSHHSRSVEHS